MNLDLNNLLVLPEESIFENTRYNSKDLKRRREVLKETVSLISMKYDYLHQQAEVNLGRWLNKTSIEDSSNEKVVHVYEGDWGEITKVLTKKHGKCFAVLNMANAYVPGGGYLQGLVAQEENMFRRSDCHFTININNLENCYYKKEMVDLINGVNGRVYLDTKRPRICIRGQERREQEDLGYEWLNEDEIFPFFEMRSAAIDLRSGIPFSEEECMKRIIAQFNTLKNAGLKYVVLGAHGCGAFLNPPEKVAEIYNNIINEFKNDFNNISFAIFNAGYGPDNFSIFKKILGMKS
jgi:hypothetical protein